MPLKTNLAELLEEDPVWMQLRLSKQAKHSPTCFSYVKSCHLIFVDFAHVFARSVNLLYCAQTEMSQQPLDGRHPCSPEDKSYSIDLDIQWRETGKFRR